MKKKVIVIAGPTAVGKTDVALKLAKRLNGEIVCADSMQVYKEVAIASNKPGKKDLRAVKHHLIDVVSVTEGFNVAQYNRLAKDAIEDILSREKTPIVCGGSGLYIQILLDGIFEGAGADIQLREKLHDEAKRFGNEFLYNKLREKDPAAAANIHPNNVKKVIRALEVCSASQQVMSSLKQKRKGLWGRYDFRLFVFNRGRDELYRRVEERVDEMVKGGLVEEIKGLKKINLSPSAKAIIGVKEINGFLDGQCGLAQATDLMKKNTRHYVKRQLTWFRKDPRYAWITINKNDSAIFIAAKVMKALES
jgi:tRNA dimethylallyltransferase